MENLIINLMEQFGYLAITFLIAIENIFPPIPSELILTFGGYIATKTSLNVILIIIASYIGAIIGALILYGIGRLVPEERIEKWLDGKIGKYLRFKKEDVKKANDWFLKHGNKTVLLCRFIPVIRSLISIPAGMCKMNFKKFLIYTSIGVLIWNSILIMVGYYLKDAWSKANQIMDMYSNVVIVLIIVTLLVLVFIIYKKQIKKTK